MQFYVIIHLEARKRRKEQVLSRAFFYIFFLNIPQSLFRIHFIVRKMRYICVSFFKLIIITFFKLSMYNAKKFHARFFENSKLISRRISAGNFQEEENRPRVQQLRLKAHRFNETLKSYVIPFRFTEARSDHPASGSRRTPASASEREPRVFSKRA